MISEVPSMPRSAIDLSSQSAMLSRARVRGDCDTNRRTELPSVWRCTSRSSTRSITRRSSSTMRPANSATGITCAADTRVPSGWRMRSSTWYWANSLPATETIGWNASSSAALDREMRASSSGAGGGT